MIYLMNKSSNKLYTLELQIFYSGMYRRKALFKKYILRRISVVSHHTVPKEQNSSTRNKSFPFSHNPLYSGALHLHGNDQIS